jgi:hypothetical protein
VTLSEGWVKLYSSGDFIVWRTSDERIKVDPVQVAVAKSVSEKLGELECSFGNVDRFLQCI